MMTKNSVVFMLMLLLTACGYHLRGAIQLPEALQKIYVRGASAELTNAIARTFRSASGELVATAAEAGMILNVINEDYQRRTISIDSSGYSNEYDLVYRLTFDLLNNQGAVLISAQTIEVSKSYFNEQSGNTVLSKGNEEVVLRKELYSQAVRSVIDRARAELKETLP
jgi:LPS-assembly lipoprotein